jgi:mycothiol system anti-sigma-R factor
VTCDKFLLALDAYLDDELAVTETLQAQEHVERCASCQRVLASEASLHALVNRAVRDEEVPARLRNRILSDINAGASRAPRRRRWWPRMAPIWLVAPAVIVAALAWLFVAPTLSDRGTSVAAELVTQHVAEVPDLELVTSDSPRLDAWLESRLGFPVNLPSLARRPERLIGGRVSSLAETPAAYVRYERDGEPISLFATRRGTFTRRGWTERHINGAEVYVTSLRGVALAWWEEEGTSTVYAAASRAGSEEVVDFALLCLESARGERKKSAR